MRLTDEQIDEMRQDAQRYGAANGWTGTSGKLAAHIHRLLAERERLLAERAELERGSKAL